MDTLLTISPILAAYRSDDGAAAALGVVGFIMAFLCGALLFVLVVEAIIAWMAYKLLSALPPEYRRQQPNMVWLLLIPVFNLVWNFFIWPKVSESYEAYFKAQGRADVGDANKGLAWAGCICMAVGIVPYLGWFCLFWCALVVMVVYLVKMFGLKAQIIARVADTETH